MMALSAEDQSLIDVVFSWSLDDVLNTKLYRGQVQEIPMTFLSSPDYLRSFIYPLIEETHADLFSKMGTLSRAPIREIYDVIITKDFKPPRNLFYYIIFEKIKKENVKDEELYEPEVGDLIAFTDVRPKCIDDLNRPKISYIIALVIGHSHGLQYLSSKPITFLKKEEPRGENDEKGKKEAYPGGKNLGKGKKNKQEDKLFAVYLTNMTTNIRIWKALKSELAGGNMSIISKLLQPNQVGSNCNICETEEFKADIKSKLGNVIHSFKLDESQNAAVLNCIATRDCLHQNTIKLIWGPPGTGKTKTVASLLFTLLRLNCRTLTCAPTNIAVLGVAARLMNLVMSSLEYDTYGLGDIVLFGNGKRMKIDDHEELCDVFLDYRVDGLESCISPLKGWKASLQGMISLLGEPEEQYRLYLEGQLQENNDEDQGKNSEAVEINDQDLKEAHKTTSWRKHIVQNIRENKKRGKNENVPQNKGTEGKKNDEIWTFEEFVMKTFNLVARRLSSCMTNLYTHLPTSCISLEVVKKMLEVLGLLQTIGTLIHITIANEGLREMLSGGENVSKSNKRFAELPMTRQACTQILIFLRDEFSLPLFGDLRNFCWKNARLIFCTASSSTKLHTEGMNPLKLLIIDEAAQLKECESTIPLMLPGIRHAILIGDDRQLPAMVQSKICEEAEFGRSLFERLVLLGHRRQLLSVQYRMHPTISLFPNKEFYDNQILDGSNVKERMYNRHFLTGKIYGSYSFINVSRGKEEFDNSRSPKNMVEVAVVAEIVSNLYRESVSKKQKLSVGCISPYKAQVFAIQNTLGKTYSTEADSDFSVNVRSVDGFQGGEMDVVVISTVRCNAKGSVGFLSKLRRANVALTRARYCLWIVGNGATLTNGGSVWKRLVIDAKARGCYYNADEDQNLSRAIANSFIDFGHFDTLLHMDSPIFAEARWKVHYSDYFLTSISRIKNSEIRKEVVTLLTKLAKGWRPPQKDNRNINDMLGSSSLILEDYKFYGVLHLVWTVDILRENSKCIQVLKVWDVLPESRIPELTEYLDNVLGNYTVDTMNRCKFRCVEGDLVVPMTWPTGSNTSTRAPHGRDYASQSLASQLDDLDIGD